MSDQIEIYPDKTKMINSLIGSALFMTAGGILIYYQGTLEGVQRVAVYCGYVIVFLFAWLFIHNLIRIFFPKAVLVIDGKGILDRTSAFSAGFIPWQDVKKVYPLKAGKQQFLSVELNNPDDYIAKLKGMKQSIMKMNIQVGHAPVKIPQSMLGITAEELAAGIKGYLTNKQ